MNSRLLNILLAVLLSTCVLSQAKATHISVDPYFIKGDNYTDSDGIEWEYLDFFDLDNGPDARDADGNLLKPISYNGLAAALALFGLAGDSLEDFAVSAFQYDTRHKGVISVDDINFLNSFDPNHADVNHMSWYDTFNSNPGLHVASESIDTKIGARGYFENGDISAYVDDRAVAGFNLNYVFRAVKVSEPASLAIFALAMFGLGVRRLKSA